MLAIVFILLCVTGGFPFEQFSARKFHANQSTDYGIHGDQALMAQESDPEQDRRVRTDEIRTEIDPECLREQGLPARQDRKYELEVCGERQYPEGSQRAIHACRRRRKPATEKKQENRKIGEAATKVVDDLPSRYVAQRIAHDFAEIVSDKRQQCKNNLPVAAHPAMFPSSESAQVGRVVVHNLNIGHQTRARVLAFD